MIPRSAPTIVVAASAPCHGVFYSPVPVPVVQCVGAPQPQLFGPPSVPVAVVATQPLPQNVLALPEAAPSPILADAPPPPPPESGESGRPKAQRRQSRPGTRTDPSKRFVGTVKNFKQGRGFGFISCSELSTKYFRDVFLHKNQFNGLRVGDEISFLVELNRDGHPQARHVELIGRRQGRGSRKGRAEAAAAAAAAAKPGADAGEGFTET